MNKDQIYEYLKEKNIWFEITNHKAVYNMQELSLLDLPYKDNDAKNIFLCDDKKNYYLITLKGDKRVDLKQFRKNNNTRHLSFAKESELFDILGLTPGSVTPLGILNDENRKVVVFIDKSIKGVVGVHPNDNTATIWIKVEDLINIIKEHGNIVNVVEI